MMQVIRLHDASVLANLSKRRQLGGMLGRLYDGQDCAMARALELIGERWTLLIVRDARFRGARRFGEFQKSLGIASNILARRLDHLVEHGIMKFDDATGTYTLTESGEDLITPAIALTEWGEKWAAPGPVNFIQGDTGERVTAALIGSASGRRVDKGAVEVQRRR